MSYKLSVLLSHSPVEEILEYIYSRSLEKNRIEDSGASALVDALRVTKYLKTLK